MRTMSGGPCLHYDCSNWNSFGYCKTTACINPKYSNIGTAQYGQGVQERIVTNADRIRAMSDEELAEWIWHNDIPYIARKDELAKWLKEEVRDEEIRP